jgi:3-hydroxyacyl-CoA dehydrogenase
MSKVIINALPVLLENDHGYLKDLGDGIALIEFKSKGNSVSIGVRAFIEDVLDNYQELYEGLVIGNESKHFSVGANVAEIKDKILAKNFKGFNMGVKSFQALTTKIKYFNKPIVSAPYKMVLGGGLEVVMHTHKSVALSKAYFGLVEIGVGLVPGGGGIKESLVRAYKNESISKEEAAKNVFVNLLIRKVSSSAQEAKSLNYLRVEDIVVDEFDNLLAEAKKVCLELVKENFQIEEDYGYLMPNSFKNELMLIASKMLEEGKISSYDLEIAETLTEVICGQEDKIVQITEDELLKRERDGFVKQTKNPKTLDRISHLLETGELLAN